MENMVKGYHTLPVENEFGPVMEQLFAVYEDGSVVTTGVIPYTDYFDKKSREWHRVDALPEGAEFIGNYPRPTNVWDTPRKGVAK